MNDSAQHPPTWKEVENLISEQKYQEAASAAQKIRISAQLAGNSREWACALTKEVQLQTGLHGREAAVSFLKEQAWPDTLLDRAALSLFYAHALMAYYSACSYEINRREKVDSHGAIELKAWTGREIYTEAQRSYMEVWKQREALGLEPLANFSDFLEPNDYPEGIRPTLRDAISYLYVELLADSSLWTPEESGRVYLLPLAGLLAPARNEVLLLEPAVHPLQKICSILSDLENWHMQNGRREAALEARLEKIDQLRANFKDPADQAEIMAGLDEVLAETNDLPWWAKGKATQAAILQESKELIRAHESADEGWRTYPDSLGGKRCYSILKCIEEPRFSMESMLTDGPQKRSIAVEHHNIPALHFRACTFDLESRLTSAKRYNLIPDSQEQKALFSARRPVAKWSAALPATPDFEDHRTFITPPMKEPGCYIVAASAKKDFSKTEGNSIRTTVLIISDLVVLTQRSHAAFEIQVLSGETGRPVADAIVGLYECNWQQRHTRVAERTTGPDGLAVFPIAKDDARYFVSARKGPDFALNDNTLSSYRGVERDVVQASLIYTDRSVYRPLQKLYWKVLAYTGRRSEPSFEAVPSAPVTISLHDPSGDLVDSRLVTTNSFGTAAGEFVIPTGRRLGRWTVRSSFDGQADVKVEEYKRPTFEVTLKNPDTPLRLNRPAQLTGEVKYYFGLPVSSGVANWRITSQPVYPFWWGWYDFDTDDPEPQTVATGTAPLTAEGTFPISFKPEADERKTAQSREITYRYNIHADVTDEGGETRSASATFRLGFISVEAQISSDAGFFEEREEVFFSVRLTDLNGNPRPGKGSYRLVALRQPEKTPLPADLPPDPTGEPAGGKEMYRTPGDSLRPRWQTKYSIQTVLRNWPDATEAVNGDLVHDREGRAKVAVPPLAAGAYRIYYETMDDFGSEYHTSRDFIVTGQNTHLALPALLLFRQSSQNVGTVARLLVLSGLPDQPLCLEIWRGGRLAEKRSLLSGREATLIEVPVREEDRGGFSVRLTALRDYQFMDLTAGISVPFDNKQLKLEFATFRDKLRPGTQETWKATVKSASGTCTERGAAELLAYMYDRSLDIFAAHTPPRPIELYSRRSDVERIETNLGEARGGTIFDELFSYPPYPTLSKDKLKFLDRYAVVVSADTGAGGRGSRDKSIKLCRVRNAPEAEEPAASAATMEADRQEPQAELRSNFAETAFWEPHLITGDDGSATIEFSVPDSVTGWNVWVHAVTRDLRSGSVQTETHTVKELMVRPYVPRFLREGDKADLKVVVNNASDRELRGELRFEILDPDTSERLMEAFGLDDASAVVPFVAAAGKGTNLVFPITVPARGGVVAFKVTAISGDMSDGELRPVPLLPGRMRLTESRFAALKNQDRREMTFERLKTPDDPTLVNEQMVVTLDAQLFYSALSALPYLVNYPYECTEQTLNRFVSTGIVSSLYKHYPSVEAMARELSKRSAPAETWSSADPNRKMALEETPWLAEARGGGDAGEGAVNVLDPRAADAERERAVAKLRKAQTASGAFPWWSGGPPSPYMTLYMMYGLAKAVEFGVDVPKQMVQGGWGFLAAHFREDCAKRRVTDDSCWEFLTFLNYVASCYPDPTWMGEALTAKEREYILSGSFRRWKRQSPYLKCMLALTLKRMSRQDDAALVFASVMDSARTTQDQGTFWAPEERPWLWSNDTIETQAFALRTLMEIEPKDSRADGLVQWLFLNKKLNHWKSTRATAEVIYSLVHYLEKEGRVAGREEATVRVGGQTTGYIFEPDLYTGRKNQTVIPGTQVGPGTATIVVEKQTPGIMFASATWQFSTEKLPESGGGDFLSVTRTYFKREHNGCEFVLAPLSEGMVSRPGDQIEVQLSIGAKHPFEYVHLRDPRAAGLEPEQAISRYRRDQGTSWYEEVRDSATNFFFELLPQGEYTLHYRLRANMAGVFRVSPATLQSMYAPEFNAHSQGAVICIR